MHQMRNIRYRLQRNLGPIKCTTARRRPRGQRLLATFLALLVILGLICCTARFNEETVNSLFEGAHGWIPVALLAHGMRMTF